MNNPLGSSSEEYSEPNLDIHSNPKMNNRSKGARMCNQFRTGKDSKGVEYTYKAFCNSWMCYRCGNRKVREVKTNICKYIREKNLTHHVTLTLDPARIPSEACPYKYLKGVWKKYSSYVRRKYKKQFEYLYVLELHYSNIPHLHVLINIRIPISDIRKHWEANGGGRIVDSEKITEPDGISRYFVKGLQEKSIPNHIRRISSSRGIKLLDTE